MKFHPIAENRRKDGEQRKTYNPPSLIGYTFLGTEKGVKRDANIDGYDFQKKIKEKKPHGNIRLLYFVRAVYTNEKPRDTQSSI